MKDHYEILGVDRDATPEEIKKPIANSRSATIQTKSRRQGG